MMDRDEIELWLQSLATEIRLMKGYCDHKRDLEDWHGIMDASADLRELLVQQRTLRMVLGEQP